MKRLYQKKMIDYSGDSSVNLDMIQRIYLELYARAKINDLNKTKLIDQLIEKLKVDNTVKTPDIMLTWGEIRIMHKNGISFDCNEEITS